MKPLSERQEQIVAFMLAHLLEHQSLPTLQTLATAFGISSVGGAAYHVDALTRRGYLEKVSRGAYRLVRDAQGRPFKLALVVEVAHGP